jgi:hypothetical protein
VSRFSTVRIADNNYSVPSRPIGERVEARLYPERVEVWFASERVVETERRKGSSQARLDRFEAILLDDMGYVQQSREEMEVLFTLLAERYERRSVLITSPPSPPPGAASPGPGNTRAPPRKSNCRQPSNLLSRNYGKCHYISR